MSRLDDLLTALGGAPALPGARCRGRHHLFDPPAFAEARETVAARHAQALGLCQHCPALARCKAWVESLPASERPRGITAGQLRQPQSKGTTP